MTKWLTLGYGTKGEVKSTTISGTPGPSGYMISYPATWMGTPLASDAQCIAEQTEMLGSGVFGNNHTDAGNSGKPLTFDVNAHLFDLTLSGYCLWTQVN